MVTASRARWAARSGVVAIILFLAAVAGGASAQTSVDAPSAVGRDVDRRQRRPSDCLSGARPVPPLKRVERPIGQQGFYKAFPPPGVEVVSWYVMMGIGQVVTLRLPASRLREVNRILEDTAWGAYQTKFYPTYDYQPLGMEKHEKAQ